MPATELGSGHAIGGASYRANGVAECSGRYPSQYNALGSEWLPPIKIHRERGQLQGHWQIVVANAGDGRNAWKFNPDTGQSYFCYPAELFCSSGNVTSREAIVSARNGVKVCDVGPRI